jgi:hypothetical protein
MQETFTPPWRRFIGKTRRIAVLAAVAALSLPATADAWGAEGHRVIALLAAGYLTPAARAQLGRLLAADRDPLTAPDIASRATWADVWRRQAAWSAPWHYIDIEIDHPDLAAACRDLCVVTAIEHFDRELRDRPTAQPERIFALKMILHLVGDIHQPLHAADAHDHGGNCEMISYSPRWAYGRQRVMKLHAFWDDGVVEALGFNPASIAQAMRNDITPAQVSDWARGVPADWARESFGVAKRVAYPGAGQLGCAVMGTMPLSIAYQRAAEAAARLQLERAGVRLAMVLNQDFPA